MSILSEMPIVTTGQIMRFREEALSIERHRDALLSACRRGMGALAHAASESPMYNHAYEDISEAIRFQSSPKINSVHVKINQAMIEWLGKGDRGAAADTMFTHLTGADVNRFGREYPREIMSWARCHALLELSPELKANLHRCEQLGPEWMAIVRNWSRLEVLYRKYLVSDSDPALAHQFAEIMLDLTLKAQAHVVTFLPADDTEGGEQ